MSAEPLIPIHGGYRSLKSFQVAQREQHGRDGHHGPDGQGRAYPGLAANAALVLIGVACALLDRQIASLAAAFEKEGGFTERLYRVRLATRNQKGPP